VATNAERRAARERVSAYHQAQLADLLSYVEAAIDRYRTGEIDAYAVDETIHHYHRAAAELWKFCFARSGGTHAEFIADLLDRMTADTEAIDWWERETPRRHQ
jgi:thiamine pyrophosphate-dependent acetolactate synthase large subunit-like protein